MRVLLAYWIFGCLVIGLPLGQRMVECPHEKIETADLVGFVAVWPAALSASFSFIGKSIPTRACREND